MQQLYHISETNLDNKLLYPRVPNNFMTGNGYEDYSTPRVSVSNSISGCSTGIGSNLTGREMYVMIAINDPEIYNPTVHEVPDVMYSGEVWGLTPVLLKTIKKIIVIDSIEEELPYQFGNIWVDTYEWIYNETEV